MISYSTFCRALLARTRRVSRAFVAVAFLAGAHAVVAAPPVPELLHYKFDQTGTSVTNHASNPPLGTATGALSGGLTQNAAFNAPLKALVGTGVSSTTDFVNTGWATSLGSGSWSISFFSSGISTSTTLYYIMGDNTAGNFRIFTNGVAGSSNWIMRGNGLTDVPLNGGALSSVTMSTFVYDSAANQVRAYLNGVLVNTVAQGALNIAGAGPFKVMGYSANVGAPAGGLLADVRIYNRAITAAEIADIYAAGTKTPQTLTFDPAPTVVVNGTANANATSASPNSGNPITYSTTSTDCSVTSAGAITGINAGTNNCVIVATQVGDGAYYEGTASLTLSIGQAAQTLTFDPAPSVLVNGTGNVNATSASPNSGNAITYSTASTDCSVTSAGVVTGINAGTNNCAITATQAGNANYAAGTATLTFSVGQATQTLTLPLQTVASRLFVLNSTFAIDPLATASSPNSGNAIAYSSLTPTICSVAGSTVTMLLPGQCTIAANLAGNANYSAAVQVSRSVQLVANGTVGGSVSGLVGTGLILSLNSGAQTVAVAVDGAFAFTGPLVQGTLYTVSVQTQPSAPAQTCAVSNGVGTMGTTSVTNVSVTCATNAFPVSIVLPAGVTSSPSGTQSVNSGNTLALVLTASQGRQILGVSGCGGSLQGNVYTTGPITGACSITVVAEAEAVQAVPSLPTIAKLLLLLAIALVGAVAMRRWRIG
jgi:Concanavalin A-like lectin/glucanases superfamily